MSIVNLVSGGLDSTLVACLSKEAGVDQYPLFIDYGQRACQQELAACKHAMAQLELPAPLVANLAGFGTLIRSGLTHPGYDIVDEAFTPGRNALFLLVAAGKAYQVGATGVAIGLLHEETSLFPDQTSEFIDQMEDLISVSIGKNIKILAPLREFRKQDVVALAGTKGIVRTYSCHLGNEKPCGMCIACREFDFGVN